MFQLPDLFKDVDCKPPGNGNYWGNLCPIICNTKKSFFSFFCEGVVMYLNYFSTLSSLFSHDGFL